MLMVGGNVAYVSPSTSSNSFKVGTGRETTSILKTIFMTSLFRIGQVLKGRLGRYIITKEIQDTVWFAKNQVEEAVVIKGVQGHPRVENERDVLKRFQDRTPYLRPLIDEIEEPSEPATIVFKYLEDHLLNASIQKTLNRKELKYVSRRILGALKGALR
ncbi:hypothetical protein ONS96_014275 [Cadophora gregata f. sp. sojae]|nr:hypothetical protein ONS96_014275 [Cadophora gregata f. sp. sojae]